MSADSAAGFPGLYDLSTKTRHPLGHLDSFQVGRHPTANLVLLDVTCSRQQFRIVRRGKQFVLEPLSATAPTRCDGHVATGPVPLRHEMVIEAGSSRFQFLEHLPSGARIERRAEAPVPPAPLPVRPCPTPMRTIVGTGFDSPEQVAPVQPIALSGQMVIGRDPQRVQIMLPHTRVSRIHARITLQQGAAWLADLHSANGTFVNGRRVVRPTVLRPSDRIDIGPYALVFDGQTLLPRSRVDNVELVCRNLRRVVRDTTTGQPLTLLDDISLVVRPGEFVCVLGPSGSGKSTLFSALSGRIPLEHGSVTINGQDFHANFDALKHDVAVVPQHVALHDALPLEAALVYTAKLRLPPDMGDGERKVIVDEMLATVGLTERRHTRIRDLSGGQLKRASLANEILSQPNLLFLDEVTSGLDEQTDREMMRLFRQIADTGKTVLCVTHSSANVEANCHVVVILASGGKLAFLGSPAEALSYFGIRRLGDVYDRLSERQPEQLQASFLQHEFHRQYIQKRLTTDRGGAVAPLPRNTPPLSQQLEQLARQARTLTHRYLRLQLADIPSLGTILGQCLLVAFLLIVFYGDLDAISLLPKKAAHCGHLLFLLAVSCLWFGCNNAAKEIVKERVIYLRERDVNVTVASYYVSKLLLLGAGSLIQATLLIGIVKYFTNLPGGFLSQWVLLGTLGLIGTSLGLLLSAMSKTNDTAVAMVPGVLLPQIILAGVIAPVEGVAKILAQLFISTYWGYRALAAVLPEEISTHLGADEWSVPAAYGILLMHLGVFIVGAIGMLMLGDPSTRLSTVKALRRWSTMSRFL
ncbi:MAG: ATP-binding cassette domain-containing protein [Planctomycetota bacterium]|nr:ATP-binding cassette domain-containing protein [Planctomycetota bacterium]